MPIVSTHIADKIQMFAGFSGFFNVQKRGFILSDGVLNKKIILKSGAVLHERDEMWLKIFNLIFNFKDLGSSLL